ncbi:FAD/NAD-P-binding domain-containing protein [Dentipellis sp. KUC8613]|nr:FAD/NAD-P-binding domain-containing protein [Dentipellis sp. KUC8613]
MTESVTKDFRVAIVGGGICGLVCAIGLVRAGIKVNIFEAASKYGEVGAGVGIGPNAVRVLREFGLLDDVELFSPEDPPSVRAFKFVLGTGTHDVLYHYPAREDDLGLGVHRASFLDALVTFLDPGVVPTHFNKRCNKISRSNENPLRTTLYFSDDTSHETDLVIGADGIRSSVRSIIVQDDSEIEMPTFTNTVAYRGLVSIEELKLAGVKTELAPSPICWMGDSRHIITFPIKNDLILNVVAFVTDFRIPMGHLTLRKGEPWVVPVSKEEVVNEYEGWGNDPLIILKSIERPTKWSLHGLYPPLNSYVKGRVGLIGDAAHAMLPHMGAGAGQGIEDAYVMTRLLAHQQTKASNLEDVLKAYDRIRRPRANAILLRSKACGDIYEGHGESGPSSHGRKTDLHYLWEEVWHHDLDADIQVGLDWLRDQGVFAECAVK